jgi:capsular exopolysaccharide synthesis family protein
MQSDSNSQEPSPNSTILPAKTAAQLVRSNRRPAVEQQPNEGITPAFIWGVFCQWWYFAIPLGLLLACISGALVWFLHVQKYEGIALVKIESEAPFVVFERGSTIADTDRFVQTQIELLRSPVVLGPVLIRTDVAAITEIKEQSDPIKFLQKHLSVQQVGKSELYQVTYVSPSAQDSATVANAIVAEYLIIQEHEDRQRSKLVIEVLENERVQRGQKVEQLRKRVVDLAKELTGRDPFGQGAVTDLAAYSSAGSIYQSLTDAEVNVEMLKAEIQSLKNGPITSADKSPAKDILKLEISNRPDVRELEAALAANRKKVAELKSKPRPVIGDSWEKDPQYQQLEKEFQATNAELEGLRATVTASLANAQSEERKSEQQRLIAAKEMELSLLDKKRDMLATKLQRHLDEFKSGGAHSAELEFAKSELDREQKVFELIAARKLALQTEMRAPARVSLTQTAKVPTNSLEPIPYKLLLLACTCAFVAPFGLSLAHELAVRRVSSREQLAQETALPVLGEISRFPRQQVAKSQHTLSGAQQRQLLIYTESVDNLRTSLMLGGLLGSRSQPRVIAICSAASGEGKTSVATSLAMSIAEACKQPTLILDADLRSPDVSKFFDVPNFPGIAEVVGAKATIKDAIHQVGNTQAYVMPAGKERVNPHHVLQNSKIERLLESLRNTFSTIVIDTPPVLSASEALVYAQVADAVVFCALADVSRAKQVRLAVERLQSTGATISGTVLSGVPVGRYVYQYGTYAHSS